MIIFAPALRTAAAPVVLSSLQCLDVAGEFMDALGGDNLSAARAVKLKVFFKELAASDGHVAFAVARHDIATVNHCARV